MTLALGCIADDYTGASDLANTLAKSGLATVQTIGVPADDLALPPADAVVVSLKSRSIPADDAVARARAAAAWLRARGAGHILFKVCSTFDSTDAGNIGPVTDALRDDAGGGLVLVTPAFPETGRTVFQGHLFVGQVPLNESPLKDHPLNPMRDSSLVRVLLRQSRNKVGLLPLAVVEQGAGALRAAAARLRDEGHGAAIVDAVFDRQLEAIGQVALDGPVSTGASGLGLGLAQALIARGAVRRQAAAGGEEAPVGGLAAALAGSCSKATLGQIEAAEAAGIPVLRLDPETLIAGPAGTAQALDWARARLERGPLLLASSAPPEQVAALQARHGGSGVGHAIEQAMAAVAEGLVAAGVRRLVVAGGETAGAVVDRLAVPAFLVRKEIAAGVPILRGAGWREPLLMALKSGNFGGPDFFARAFDMMR